MTKQKWLLAAVLLILATIAAIHYPTDKPGTSVVPKQEQHIASSAEFLLTAPTKTNTPADTSPNSMSGVANSWVSSQEVIAGQEASDKVAFKADANGRIVADEEARLNIEKLVALNTAEQLASKQQALESSLPPTAARELVELIERFRNYQVAQLQTLPPGQEPASAEDGLAQIDVLHALRVQHFGSVVAESFFGAEEKVQRQLLHLMSLEKDQSMTMEEKAAKAQQLIQSQPDLASIYATDRIVRDR